MTALHAAGKCTEHALLQPLLEGYDTEPTGHSPGVRRRPLSAQEKGEAVAIKSLLRARGGMARESIECKKGSGIGSRQEDKASHCSLCGSGAGGARGRSGSPGGPGPGGPGPGGGEGSGGVSGGGSGGGRGGTGGSGANGSSHLECREGEGGESVLDTPGAPRAEVAASSLQDLEVLIMII